jgi:hypothetical protein
MIAHHLASSDIASSRRTPMYGLELFAMQYPFMGSNAQFLQGLAQLHKLPFPQK